MSNDRRPYTRRQFLARAGTAGIVLSRAWPLKAVAPAASPKPKRENSEGQLESLKKIFLNPPDDARPMTRWWWFGGAVTPEEITRELTLMREAGLRGAEIQPLYPVAVDDPARGIRNLRYFSPEWFEVLRHTIKEAKRLGLQLDFTLGSGWPYGGPFIPVDLAARRLRYLSQDVVGPREFSWDLTPQILGDEKVVSALALPVFPSEEPDIRNSRIITDQLKEPTPYNLRRSLRIDRWSVPAGQWRIMIFIDTPTGMQVKRPTLGVEGYVLDHFSREAMELFLSAAGDRVLNQVRAAGDPPFHSIFCDSLEVYGADWTSSFLEEFHRRRGYDLTPYLPALAQEAGPLTPHVRYDYHLTLSDLILDYFFRPLVDWAERNRMKARIQAHGAFGDVMQGYALSHIPEGENIFLGDRHSVNLRHRRLASSAGHIYGKSVISAETYTWLRVPLFLVTLEMMKAATDAVFLDGINHIVNHGYSYSPPLAGQPGWVFYASTLINHNNIWWRHYPHLVNYAQRVSGLLREGFSLNPVAVYIPLADVLTLHGAGGLHIDVEIESHLAPGLFLELRRAGYDFDLINDHALENVAEVKGGKLRAGGGEYAAVIVPPARFMPPESLDRLAEFAESGGVVIFIARLPEAAPGLENQEQRTARLRAALRRLWRDTEPTPTKPVLVGGGKVGFATNHAELLAQLRASLYPDFGIVEAGDRTEDALRRARENVGFVHRRSGALDYFFLSNISPRVQDLRVGFAVGHRRPERWNPETGACEETLVYQYLLVQFEQVKATEVQLRLEPFESCFVVFGTDSRPPEVTRTNWPGALRTERSGGRVLVSGVLERNGDYFLESARGKRPRFSVRNIPEPVAIEGPWKLSLGDGPAVTLSALQSWNDLPEGKSYSGWATYEASFEFAGTEKDLDWVLDLGTVHETAEVTLNRVPLGAAWKGLRRLACRDALRAGRNHLKIEVANLWIHKVRAQPKPDLKPLAETFGIRWGRYGEIEPESIPPSGLLGPVRLVPSKRLTLKL